MIATRAALVAITCLPAPAQAHDFWMEPERQGRTVHLRLRVGDGPEIENRKLDSARVIQLRALGRGGAAPLVTRPGGDPVASFEADPAQPHVAVYQGNFAAIEMEREKFAAYLQEEGLPAALDLLAGANARERNARCAKAHVGGVVTESQAAGCPLEILLEGGTAEALAARVVFQGKGLAGVLVRMRDNPTGRTLGQGVTDAEGRVKLAGARTASVRVVAVHMTRSTDPAADVESYWASTTGGR